MDRYPYEKIFPEPSTSRAFFHYGGNTISIDTFYYFNRIWESRKQPNFSITDKRFRYVTHGKTLVTGQLGLHYMGNMYLPYLVAKVMGVTGGNTSGDTSDRLKEDLEELVRQARENLSFNDDTGDVQSPVARILASLTPTERTAFAAIWNSLYLEEKAEEDEDMIQYGFNIADVDTTGLDLEIVFYNQPVILTSLDNESIHNNSISNIYLKNVHFIKSTLNYSVDTNSPVIEVHTFFAEM